MRVQFAASFVFLASALGAWSQSTTASLLSELPSCALSCLGTAIQSSTCAPTNQTCLCTNSQLQTQVTSCVTKTCTVKEALTTKNITNSSCDVPVRDKGDVYNYLAIILGSISGGIVVLRFASKFVTGSTFWLDDYFIGITLLAGIPSTVLSVRGLTANGLGRDIWTVTFDQITDFAHIFYVMELLYFVNVALLKLSLLFFYLRVFPGAKLRQLLWGSVAVDFLFGFVFVLTGLLQCQPMNYYWNMWDGEHQGRCINVNAVGWANAAISIALDVWMIGLPMSQVIKLKLHWKKKIGVGIMFGVGTFVTIVSILRLQSLTQFANSDNPTWDNFAVSQWSTIEINTGIICACLPSLRVLLVYLFPKVLGSSHRSNAEYYTHNSTSRVQGNASVSRSRHVSVAGIPNKGGIVYSQSYTVDRNTRWEHDETYLVLDDTDAVSLNSINPPNNTPEGQTKTPQPGSLPR